LNDYLGSIANTLDRPPRLVLTGGRLGQALVSSLAAQNSAFGKLGAWISWGDERLVPYDSPESNSGEALLRFPELRGSELFQFSVAGSLTECRDRSDAELAAWLRPHDSDPLFELVLLGIGEDGHVASLFPGAVYPPAGAGGLVAGVEDSPKPPRQRLTLTLSTLNRSRAVWFLAAGSEKQQAVSESMDPSGSIPASMVRGQVETRWYLEQNAAPEGQS
ncbi:MAG: hypothetical protein RL198_965, partial [Actinomycetota bacterium]